MFHYSYYGLHVLSRFEIAEMPPCAFGEPDVEISFGSIVEPEEFRINNASLCFHSASNYVFKMDDGLLIQVVDGTVIRIGCDAGVWSQFARNMPYLLGPVFSSLLQQRGYVVLHASVVSGRNRILAVAGPSGAGKSTLACQFLLEEYHLVADDICAMKISETRDAIVGSALPRLKLLPDAGRRLNISLDRCRKATMTTEKRSFNVGLTEFVHRGRVNSILVLREGEGELLTINILHGTAKLAALLENMFWRDYARGMGNFQDYFQQVSKLAQIVPVYEIRYNKKLHSPQDMAMQINRYVLG